jgi:hypothetical protein
MMQTEDKHFLLICGVRLTCLECYPFPLLSPPYGSMFVTALVSYVSRSLVDGMVFDDGKAGNNSTYSTALRA